MSFSRRTLIGAAIATGVTVNKGFQSFWTGISSISKFRFSRKQRVVEAKVDKVYVAQPNTLMKLPENAPNGAVIRIVVDKDSLSHPCMLQNVSGKVGGDTDPLVLDSLAIIKLEYDKSTNDWLLA